MEIDGTERNGTERLDLMRNETLIQAGAGWGLVYNGCDADKTMDELSRAVFLLSLGKRKEKKRKRVGCAELKMDGWMSHVMPCL